MSDISECKVVFTEINLSSFIYTELVNTLPEEMVNPQRLDDTLSI